jgi:hypothetical protein
LKIKIFNFDVILVAEASNFTKASVDKAYSPPAAIWDFFGIWHLAFGIFIPTFHSCRHAARPG